MATLKIFVRNGKFVEEESYVVYKENFSEREVNANGWSAKIDRKGKIVCDAVRDYAKGTSSIRYTIFPSGYAKLTLATEGGKPQTIREGYVVKQGEKLEGTIGLSGGKVDDRYAYFRSSNFIEFLNKNKLCGVIRVNPNREYLARNYYLASGEKNEEVITDGVVEEIKFTSREDIPEDSCCYDNRMTLKVSGATWAKLRDKEDGWGYLYTLEKNVTSIDFKKYTTSSKIYELS